MNTCDVLILGAGLAGLRSAWSAALADPNLSVAVAAPSPAPSGSSFANRNNALGYQLLLTDDERASFVREAETLAAPGFFDPALARVLAEESLAQFHDLEGLELAFRRDESGDLIRYTGCGSPAPRAVIFDDLAQAHERFTARCQSLGVRFLPFEGLGILMADGRAVGAWGTDDHGAIRSIRARAMVAAMGGPAPLYARNIAGARNPGFGLGLLAETGARLANTGYLQFFWSAEDGSFRTPAELLVPDNRVLAPDGNELDPAARFGDDLPALLASRNTHCPALYGHEDAVLDEWLLAAEHPDGFARVRTPGGVERVALMAHAGNGGAVVNEFGETSVAGLLAVGENATGMHGANRMGGAMVLATQVLGHRAGTRAAKLAATAPLADDLGPLPDHQPADTDDMAEIRAGLTTHATFTRRTDRSVFAARLHELVRSQDARIRAAARTALSIMNMD